MDLVYDAIKEGFNNAVTIGEVIGEPTKNVSSFINKLKKRGEIVQTGVIRKTKQGGSQARTYKICT